MRGGEDAKGQGGDAAGQRPREGFGRGGVSTCHLTSPPTAVQILPEPATLTPASALGLPESGLSSEAAGPGAPRAPTPQPRSLAVPGEGAEEPDAGRQRGPHRARRYPKRSRSGGGRGAGHASRADNPRGLNAPPAGPPRLGNPQPLAPAPLHLTALGAGWRCAGRTRPAHPLVRPLAREFPVLRLGPWTRGPPRLCGPFSPNLPAHFPAGT